jgi:hypothetical protein
MAIFLENQPISFVENGVATQSAYLETDLAEVPQRPQEGRHCGGVVVLKTSKLRSQSTSLSWHCRSAPE